MCRIRELQANQDSSSTTCGIVNTQPDSVDGSAIGIVVAPSTSITSERVEVSGIWNVAAAQRSYATVVDSRIDGARGSGFLVEGSDIEIDRTSIRRVIADERGRSAGIRVRRWWLGDLAASLNLARSTIAEVEGAGVHLDDVDSAKLRDVTIRDVATPAEAEANPGMFGGCAGNGIRARSRMPEASVSRRSRHPWCRSSWNAWSSNARESPRCMWRGSLPRFAIA